MNLQNLIKRFAEAELELTAAQRPIISGRLNNGETFQLDIRRRRTSDPHSEHFLVWPGHEENIAVVQATDRELAQLVMMVKEGKREFWEQVPNFALPNRKTQNNSAIRAHILDRVGGGASMKDVVKNDGAWWIRRSTTDRKRHFLMGRDERQLFMCQLPRACTSVQEAHSCLKAPTVRMFEGKAEGKTIRQGEWFFVNIPQEVRDQIEDAVKHSRLAIRKKVNIGTVITRVGKPHTADELVVFDPDNNGGVGQRAGGTVEDVRNGTRHQAAVFVRGSVRHADHETVYFAQWRRVIKNQERNEGQSSFGGRWID